MILHVIVMNILEALYYCLTVVIEHFLDMYKYKD
jgi:hypothetical protein